MVIFHSKLLVYQRVNRCYKPFPNGYFRSVISVPDPGPELFKAPPDEDGSARGLRHGSATFEVV